MPTIARRELTAFFEQQEQHPLPLYTRDDLAAEYERGLNASQPRFENGVVVGVLLGMAFAGTLLFFFSI